MSAKPGPDNPVAFYRSIRNAVLITVMLGVVIWLLAGCTGGAYHRTPQDHQIAVIFRSDLTIDHSVKETVGLPIHWLAVQVQGAAVTFRQPIWILVDCVLLLPNPTENNPATYYAAVAQHEAGNCADFAHGEQRDPATFELTDDEQIRMLKRLGVMAFSANKS